MQLLGKLTLECKSCARFKNVTHQYGRHNESLILQVFDDLSVNIAIASRKVDTLGAIPSTDLLQALLAIQLDDV
jgi:hypothetical protein